ncbi:unnamed protein product [Urochloa humidicola]
MAPTLRAEGEPPPVYGADTDNFTVEVHHGGFFVGHAGNRAYIDGKVNWFDFCEVDTWSPLWFDDFVEQLHYEPSYSLRIYWLLPGKDMSDGLRLVSSDQDTNVMAAAVMKHRNLVMYFDHDDNISGINWDDIVANPITSLPKVLSPSKMAHVDSNRCEKLPVFYSNLEKSVPNEGPSGGNADNQDSGSECDSDFVDSDYELAQEDDDLFMDNVDEDVVDEGVSKGVNIGKGKKTSARKENFDRGGDEVSSDEDDLQLPKSDDEGQLRMRFKSFKGEDLENPTFSVGMIFGSVELIRKAIREYSLKHRVEISMPRNEKTRFRAVCTSDGCPWNLYASIDSRTKGLMVKTFNGEHNCQKKWVLKNCTSNWLANKYLEHFRADQKDVFNQLC